MRAAARLARTVVAVGLRLAAPVSAAVDVQARLEPARIGLEDLARLTIEVRGGVLDDLGLKPEFELENLQIAGGATRSSQFSSINGRISRVESVQWLVRPLAPGTGTVRGIRVEVDGEAATPPDLEIEIIEGSLAPERPRRDPWRDPFPDLLAPFEEEEPAAEPKVFLRAEAHPADPWVGQQVTYVLYLFSQTDVGSIHPEELPDFQGFWVQEVDDPRPREPDIVDVDGERYARVPLLRRMLFPLRPGEVTLEPVRIRVGVQPRRLGFGRIQRGVELWRSTNTLTLTVRPLPAAPDGFDGAVGKLQVAMELRPSEVAVGEAATLTLTLSGTGHLQGLPAPELPRLDGVRTFPPRQESDERVVGNRVQARKSWSWVLLPDRPGRWEVPEVRMPTFDPEAGEYRWTRAAAQELTASPAASIAAAAQIGSTSPPDATAQGRPAEPPRPDPLPAWTGTATRVATIVLIVCGLGLVGVLLWRRRGRPGAASAARLRQALQEARHAPDPRRAAAGIEEALRHLLERRWEIGRGRPSARWPELLRAHGLAAETAEEIARLGEDLHYLRYAPELADADQLLDDVMRRSRRLARVLE